MNIMIQYVVFCHVMSDWYCKGRVLATRTKGCEFESHPSHIKDLKNGNRYTQLSTKLESDIDKPERWLSSGQMLCERLLCLNGELNALGPPTQDPH